MKLTQDDELLATNKVLILYILNKIEKAITNDGLYNLVLSVVDMNYFYFQQFLLDLISNNYITSFMENDRTVYKITELGSRTLELTLDILPGIFKLKVDINLKSELKASNEQASITAEFVPISETDYTVTCKINENDSSIFEVKVYCGSRDEAKKIVDNWKDNAYKIYPEILASLNNVSNDI